MALIYYFYFIWS